MLDLPPEFISNILNTFEEKGDAFLRALPDSIAAASARWGLMDVQPASNLSYNFVAFANRGEERVVLKMGVPNRERISEMAALRLFAGEGACRLIDYAEEKCWMLLECLTPGVMLSTLEDDEEATHIAVEVMQKIWRSMELPEAERSEGAGVLSNAQQQAVGLQNSFIQLTDWFDGLKRLRAMFHGGTGPLDERLVDRVERAVQDFFGENHKPVLMHGDFHHFNILSSERGWLVIDPKGVIGPAGYEAGPFLMNPWGDLTGGTDYRGITRRRIDILHERLGFEHERIREWGVAHAVLSAWWGIEDSTGWEYSLAFAEMLADLDIK